MDFFGPSLIFILIAASIFFSAVKVLNEWERGVVLRLGRSVGVRGPGLILLIPYLEKLVRLDLRVVPMDVPSQDVITQDNISLKVNAVIYFKVVDPEKAVTKISDYYFATSQFAQTTLRSVLGKHDMDEILSQRDKINLAVQEIVDKRTEEWGLKISAVEIKNIDLPKEMQSAMARQAEAERERRAKVIGAEGEFQRAQKLSEAADVLEKSPAAIQLAYLQALNEIAGEGTKTIVFPIPIDLLKGFMDRK